MVAATRCSATVLGVANRLAASPRGPVVMVSSSPGSRDRPQPRRGPRWPACWPRQLLGRKLEAGELPIICANARNRALTRRPAGARNIPQATDPSIISAALVLPGFCTQWHIACFDRGERDVAGDLSP